MKALSVIYVPDRKKIEKYDGIYIKFKKGYPAI